MALILGKKVVGRLETLEYANAKFGWGDVVIGISCYFGFWAWLLARLTRRKCIYYAIDFYSPEIAQNLWDRIFIWAAIKMDGFLVRHCDGIWDISPRIGEGRLKFGKPDNKWHTVVPLCYPKSYFMNEFPYKQDRAIFVGLQPYGLELLKGIDLVWLGKNKLLPIDELLATIAKGGFGVALWKGKGNHYYGDPGKTKLYSACGLPVITTGNTVYAHIIEKTGAGVIVDYNEESVKNGIEKLLDNYEYYKGNVPKTWKYINADDIFRNFELLG